MYRYLFLLAFTVFPMHVHAACSTPTGSAGEIIYNSTYNVVQYCNGTNWINTGQTDNTATGTACTTPTQPEGAIIYNSSQGVIQFCNGDGWMDTACAATVTAGGGGCTSPSGNAGSIIYESNNNRLQFCDSTNWVNMGTACSGGGSSTSVADVFSTDLYTGTGSNQNITSGLDLSGSNGMVWIKGRSGTARDHNLFDTLRGVENRIRSNSSSAQQTIGNSLSAFNVDGFRVGADTDINANSETFVAWTFREAPKFFDIVTYTGTGSAGLTFSHDLGVVPGMIMIKRVDDGASWMVSHRSLSWVRDLKLDDTGSSSSSSDLNSTAPTSSSFQVGSDSSVNGSGNEYVVYLFAHDDSADGVIQCGEYAGSGVASGNTVTLGWQPQWVIIKGHDIARGWVIFDSARSASNPRSYMLYANENSTENDSGDYAVNFTSTGFELATTEDVMNDSGKNYLYCAIRAE